MTGKPASVAPGGVKRCVCGHDTVIHLRSAGMCLNLACGCERVQLDDGTDGSTVYDGPRSDPYKGIYGINRRYAE